MKKRSFKEYYNDYSNWCSIGRENNYGIFLLLLTLPVSIFLFTVTYFCGYSTGYNVGKTDQLCKSEVTEEDKEDKDSSPRYINIS